jgi:hypothetical protein
MFHSSLLNVNFLFHSQSLWTNNEASPSNVVQNGLHLIKIVEMSQKKKDRQGMDKCKIEAQSQNHY